MLQVIDWKAITEFCTRFELTCIDKVIGKKAKKDTTRQLMTEA